MALGRSTAALARILIAEGDYETRMLYRATLEALNCVIVEVTDSRQALVAAINNPPSIIITDTDLLPIDGYSLLRHDAATRNDPILVVTGRMVPLGTSDRVLR
jgi:DNA-binding response OmpR family regulator